jgi:GH25 family lysozyme M1 (1,4-beta-N-acetylmuramidase)
MTDYLDTWSQSRNHAAEDDPGALAFEVGPAMISGLDPSTLAICVDYSHWQGDVDIAKMKAEGGVAMAMPKASDGKQVVRGNAEDIRNYVDDYLDRNIQRCYDAGVPCGPYHYVQVYFDDYSLKSIVDANLDALHAALDAKVPNVSYHAIVLDVEEKNNTNSNGSWIVIQIIEAIRKDPKFSKVRLLIYTSESVLAHYTDLREYLGKQDADFNLWMAQWIYGKVTKCSWAHLINNIIPGLSMRVRTPGWATWKMVQWSDAFILPGGSGRTDLNFFCGSRALLYSWLGYQGTVEEPVDPKPEPKPEPEPMTGLYMKAIRFVNIRAAATAASQDMGDVQKGERVGPIVGIAGGKTGAWAHLANGLLVCVADANGVLYLVEE